MVIKVAKRKDFAGAAKVELLGLPNEVTTEPREITKDTTELVFPVKTDGQFAGRPPQDPVLPGRDHGQRRADRAHAGHRRAADRRAAAPQARRSRAAAAPCPPLPAAAAPPAEKRLSRLEKLRLERQQAKAAAKARRRGEMKRTILRLTALR